MLKGYRAYVPEQDLRLPPSLGQWLPEGHLAYFVSDVVDPLDLTPMHAEFGDERRGRPHAPEAEDESWRCHLFGLPAYRLSPYGRGDKPDRRAMKPR